MKTIQIDDAVYDALAQRVKGFNETPSDVIARLLKESPNSNGTSQIGAPTAPKQTSNSDIQTILASPDFQRSDAIERYMSILSFLYRRHPEKFDKLEFYRRKGGRRVNFSKDINKIEESGNSTLPKRIPGSPFFVLTNLDNNSKRSILSDILPTFGYSHSDIREILRELPDSGISRPKRIY